MSQAVVENKKSTSSRPLLPPEESFWQRYSPHYEFPLATVSAVTLFATALGLLFLIWILHGFYLEGEGDGPPRVDAVESPNPGGGGLDGNVADKGKPGADGGGNGRPGGQGGQGRPPGQNGPGKPTQ